MNQVKNIGYICACKMDEQSPVMYFTGVNRLNKHKWSTSAQDAIILPPGDQYQFGWLCGLDGVKVLAYSIEQLEFEDFNRLGSPNPDIHVLLKKGKSYLIGFDVQRNPLWHAVSLYDAARYSLDVKSEIIYMANVFDAEPVAFRITPTPQQPWR